MPSRFIKDPDAVLDYQIDWSDYLDDDTITTSTWTVPEGIIKDSDTKSDAVATVWLSGGTDGVSYSLVNHIVTDAGREDDRTIVVMIQEK
jgi:hypothetical protein